MALGTWGAEGTGAGGPRGAKRFITSCKQPWNQAQGSGNAGLETLVGVQPGSDPTGDHIKGTGEGIRGMMPSGSSSR